MSTVKKYPYVHFLFNGPSERINALAAVFFLVISVVFTVSAPGGVYLEGGWLAFVYILTGLVTGLWLVNAAKKWRKYGEKKI